jgi:glycosyltransferase involved in cell wall biosynthesis
MGKSNFLSFIPGITRLSQTVRPEFLSPSDNSEALALAIEKLMKDKSLRKSMGIAGRERAKEFSFDGMMRKYERLFEDMHEKVNGKGEM